MPAPIENTVLGRQADDDGALVQRILCHDHAAFEVLMRRYNAKLYRVARSILKNDADVEEVLQEDYVIDDLRDMPAVIADVNQRLANGERP